MSTIPAMRAFFARSSQNRSKRAGLRFEFSRGPILPEGGLGKAEKASKTIAPQVAEPGQGCVTTKLIGKRERLLPSYCAC